MGPCGLLEQDLHLYSCAELLKGTRCVWGGHNQKRPLFPEVFRVKGQDGIALSAPGRRED